MSVRATRRYCCLLILSACALAGWPVRRCHAQDVEAQAQQQAEVRALMHLETISEGTSSRRVRDEAIDEFPLRNLRAANRELAEEILDDISLFRRLPTVRCEMSPEVYSYFRSHPDMAVAIWHVMGISAMQLEQKSDYSYEMSTGDGTQGDIHVLLRTPNNIVMLCDGEFMNPVTNNPIEARALFHLVTHFQRDDAGRTWLTHHADMFVMFPSTTIETVARMISPVSNRICDQNFEEITMFVRLIDVGTVRRPEWVRSLADQVEGVSEDSRLALAELVDDAAPAGPAVPDATATTSADTVPMPMPMLFGEDLFPMEPMTGAIDGPSVN